MIVVILAITASAIRTKSSRHTHTHTSMQASGFTRCLATNPLWAECYPIEAFLVAFVDPSSRMPPSSVHDPVLIRRAPDKQARYRLRIPDESHARSRQPSAWAPVNQVLGSPPHALNLESRQSGASCFAAASLVQDQTPEDGRLQSAMFATAMDPEAVPLHAHPLLVHGVSGHNAQDVECTLCPGPSFQGFPQNLVLIEPNA